MSDENKIRQIRIPGNERVETGPVQFVLDSGPDWPSLHIRGDNAAYLAMCIKDVLDCLKTYVPKDKRAEVFFAVNELESTMNQISTGVIVGPCRGRLTAPKEDDKDGGKTG